jgi:chemotaxis protein MotB
MNSSVFASNWELSSVRACSVLHIFEKAGFPPGQLTAIGWGDTKPIVANDTPESRSQNRRVVIKILRK